MLNAEEGGWTVGALVQVRRAQRLARYPVGSVLQDTPSPYDGPVNVGVPGMGSIVITIATDAPLLPHQCTRLAHGHEQTDRTERPGQGGG